MSRKKTTEEELSIFGAKMVKHLNLMGKKQKELARVLNEDERRITAWKRGETWPPLDVAYKIATYLQVPLDFLADDSIKKKEDAELNDEEKEILERARTIGLKCTVTILEQVRICGGYESAMKCMSATGPPVTGTPTAGEQRRQNNETNKMDCRPAGGQQGRHAHNGKRR